MGVLGILALRRGILSRRTSQRLVRGFGHLAAKRRLSTIYPITYNASNDSGITDYVLKVSNAQQKYYQNDKPRFKLFVREKNWNPTIYTVASTEIEPTIIEKAYYRLFRVQDNFEVVPYGTGSTQHTLLSFDVNGNYFDFDMSILEKGYMYD